MWELIGTALTGGATGFAGTLMSKVFGVWERKQAMDEDDQKHRQELELRKLDIELAKVEAANAEKQTALALESEAMAGSYKEASKRWSKTGDPKALVWVDVVRGLTRPALTILFLALTAAIWFTTDDAAIKDKVTHTVLYMATVTGCWWFGTRAVKPTEKDR